MSHLADTTREANPTCLVQSMEWVRRLVSIDTVSHTPNIGLIEMVRDELKSAGVDATLTASKDRKWANLFATVPAWNGEKSGGVVLSGHTDVVPVDGQDWASDPFKPEIRDGKLYGRGTCDMKGFIGVAVAMLPQMQAVRLAKPIHFALSFDEEVGCAGAPLMIADVMKRGIKPEGCIVGEPTGMRPVVAHKGINAFSCCVRGHAAHSSLTPKGLNAIEYAARLICFIRDMADGFQANGPFDELFDVPFTTSQTSMISGGIAINTVPSECRFEFEFRNLPMVDPQSIIEHINAFAHDTLLPKMLAENPAAAIDISRLATAPGLDAAEHAAITKLVRALTANQDRRKVPFTTEAGLFQNAGIPSIVCGPGDVDQAHKPNEFVTVDQLVECERFLSKFICAMSVNAE